MMMSTLSLSVSAPPRRMLISSPLAVANQAVIGIGKASSATFGFAIPCLRLRASPFRVSCSAKPETVEKVCSIVRKQLALSDDTPLTPESKFIDLGADSLDTVEIVMGLEEEFEISVEEDGNQNITTVQEAADLIEKLVQTKSS